MKVVCSTVICAVALVACGTRGDEASGEGGMDAATDASAEASTSDLSIDAPGFDADLPDGTCAAVRVATTRTTPNVLLVIDASGSMVMDFDSGHSRWNVLRDALTMSPDGLVNTLQTEVRFGAVMYTDDPEPPACPDVFTTPTVLNGLVPIGGLYGMSGPSGNTPTGDTIQYILTNLDTLVPDHATDPTILVLATDGEPGTCASSGDVGAGRALTVNRVAAAHTVGVDTYVISVGVGIALTHLQDVANAGLGVPAGGPDAQYWVANDTTGLHDALHEIVGGLLSCHLELVGHIVPARACEGTVTLGGTPLVCGTDWRAVDATHIELLGTACDTALAGGGELIATFPCDVLI